jgi:signal transduction histidine kinase
MGIGLAVVKRIVEDHGFSVEVESADAGGTTFRVRIPAPSALAPIEAPPPSSAPANKAELAPG